MPREQQPLPFRHAHSWLRCFLEEYETELITIAEGRLALGSFAFPEGPLYLKTREELAVEIAEELADAIVYAARRLELG